MNDIIHNTEDVVVLDQELIGRLKSLARESPKRRSRICLHRSPHDPTHEMIIAVHHGSYLRPHRHPVAKSESYHVIEGRMDVILFTDTGEVQRRIELSPTGPAFAYRLCAPLWHMPLPRSEWLIYHEVFTGPFDKQLDVEYAPWAPLEGDETARLYLQQF